MSDGGIIMSDVNDVEEEVLTKAYSLVKEFLDAVNRMDFELLKSRFDISKAVYEEIQVELDETFRDFGKEVNLSQPSLDIAFTDINHGEPFAIYRLRSEDGSYADGCFGIECLLWNNSKMTELTARFYMVKKGSDFRLEYRCMVC